MDVLVAIKSRRSIRAFEDRRIPEGALEKLIDAASCAPSAGNIQPWIFVIVRKPEGKQLLAQAALRQTFIQKAPLVIVVCADEARSSGRYGDRGRTLYCLQDTSAAIENIILSAHSLGLGACWVGAFREDAVRQILMIPYDVRPVAIVPVGYPAESPPPRRKRSFQEIVRYESF